MNVKELNLIKKQHEETMMDVLDILSKHIKDIPSEIIKDFENYHNGFIYQIEACIDGQLEERV